MIVEALGTQVLVETYKPEIKKNKAGIILPDDVQERWDADKMPFIMGKVASIGGMVEYVKVGDIVLFERHTPVKFTYNDKDYYTIKEPYITARIKPDVKAEA